jgi:subtilisin family serine protease
MRLRPIFFFVALCSLQFLNAQGLDHKLGEYIVRLNPNQQIDGFLSSENYLRSHSEKLSFKAKISKELNVWLLTVDANQVNELDYLRYLRAHPSVHTAQLNHVIQWRETIPDDPRLSDQWYLYNTGQNEGTFGADINMVEAWDITTGGTTAAGDEIVVAIIDNGISLDHPDLANNIWINEDEIPDNGIDDDLNGYMDDYYGYNIDTDNGAIGDAGEHGTEVAGLIGAKGNDGVGMAGVNWQVKIMNLQKNFNSLVESDVLEGYGYILNQRIEYNRSKGTKGAFVVATNASWGIDGAFAEEAPLWCAFYDTLGAHGVLSVGATTNNNDNVDELGDLPTTCPSEYLIGVTGSDRNDELAGFGYGKTNIDLAAPGQEIITSSGADGYNLGSDGNGQNGTSFATPLVAGAIALAYSAPCFNLAARSKSDPAGTALEVRNLILDNVQVIEAWTDLIASSGRLDVGKTLQSLMAACGSCPTPINLQANSDGENAASISWEVLDSISSVNARYRAIGSEEWTDLNEVASGTLLENLGACTTYEMQFTATCPSNTSEFSESFQFTTEGCCKAPENITASVISTDFLEVTWDPVMGADTYEVMVRPMGSETWRMLLSDTNSILIDSLSACTFYEMAFTTACTEIENQETSNAVIRTFGCSECKVESYCESFGSNAQDDWLEQVIIEGAVEGINNLSGSDGGYGNYTIVDTFKVQFAEDEKFNLTIVPGFSYTGGTSAFLRAWIDYNFDGDFNDAGELIFDTPNEVDTAVTQSFFVPMLDSLGFTALRIMMKSNFGEGVDRFRPSGCDSFALGEVEDYCIELIESRKICPNITGFEIDERTANMISLKWDTVVNDVSYLIRYKRVKDDDDEWSDNMLPETDTTFVIGGLKSCTEYQVQIISICQFDTSSMYEEIIMTDGSNCMVGINPIEALSEWKAIPNPFNHYLELNIRLNEPIPDLEIELFNLQGQPIYNQSMSNLSASYHKIQLDDLSGKLSPGIYFIRLKTHSGIAVKRLIKN